MKISTKGRYGLRAMLDLAVTGGGYVSLADIAQRQDLSLNYMESIFSVLKRSGFVQGMAGSKGGYRLTRPAEQINLKELLEVLEGDLSLTDPLPAEGAPKIRSFLKETLWDVIDEKVASVLAEATLADLAGTIHHL